MTLLERVRAAGNAAAASPSGIESREELVAGLCDEVRRAIPVDELARIAASNPERARNEVRSACRAALREEPWCRLASGERSAVVDEVADCLLGLGPIESLLADDSVTEIMVNGSQSLYCERNGVLERCEASFADDEQVRALIDRIIGPLGRRIDEASPLVSARLPEGHRVHAVIPPLSVDGPVLTIRTFAPSVITTEDLVRFGSLEPSVAQLLRWAVISRKGIAVSGGTGSGKTTLLNALSCHVPHTERIITIEDSAELRFLEHPHVVRLEARPRNAEGLGEVTIRDLVINALRMRPDRIIVGECRGGEALDMLQAMTTGHAGSMTTLHANSPREAVARLVTLVRYAADLPVDVIEMQVGSAFDLMVQTARMPSGLRAVCEVAQVGHLAKGRGCEVRTLYARDAREPVGRWEAEPPWVARLAPDSMATEEEVAAWRRSAHLAS